MLIDTNREVHASVQSHTQNRPARARYSAVYADGGLAKPVSIDDIKPVSTFGKLKGPRAACHRRWEVLQQGTWAVTIQVS